jgi:hypothetical protein
LSVRPAAVLTAGGFFSLLDERLKLGGEAYSPRMVEKIEYAGGNLGSFQAGQESLEKLSELEIGTKHVQTLTERLGRERAQERDALVESLRNRTLKPPRKEPPLAVAIHLDAGKMQFREEEAGVGVHAPRWGDTKAACLQTYTPLRRPKDPQPNPPAHFLDPNRVRQLCAEMERVRNNPAEPGVAGGTETPPPKDSPPRQGPQFKPRLKKGPKLKRPQRLVRTVVATTQGTEPFGWMVAAEAASRRFYQAIVKAIVGDGGNWIWPLADLHFPGWTQILDFLHLLVHLWAAATAAYRGQSGGGQRAWDLYEQMLRDAWRGNVKGVLEALEAQARRLGDPPPKPWAQDPRQIVRLTLNYVKENQTRMDYAKYRRDGLPISSALVESLIKQINYRMKGTEKFWNGGGGEAVLQVRSAYLSEDGRAEEFHSRRPRANAVGSNRRLVLQAA